MAERHPQTEDAAPRSRHRRAVRGGVRERRLVDLLRARRHRGVRPRADADRFVIAGVIFAFTAATYTEATVDVPGGRRLLQLRPARVQRARVVRRGVGADAQLHDHGRHLGVLRASLPERLLAGARPRPGRHLRRHRGRRDPRGAERHGTGGVLPAQPDPRHRGPVHPDHPGGHRDRPRVQPGHPGQQRPLGRGAELGGLRARDRRGDDRLHGDRDDLEHVRGGARCPADDPARRRLGGGRRPRALRPDPSRGALCNAGDPERRGPLQHRSRHQIRRRPRPRDRGEPRAVRPYPHPALLRRCAGGGDPHHRDERGPDRRVAAHVLDGAARQLPDRSGRSTRSSTRRTSRSSRSPAWPSSRCCRARQPSWRRCTRSARCCRSRSRTFL